MEIAGRLHLPDRYVVAVSTMEPRKGLDVLVAALACTTEDVAAVVIGPSGWGGVDLPLLATRAGVPERRLQLVGRIADRELAVVLGSAAMLVMPSRAEGFGLPVAEALTVGTPVVCTRGPPDPRQLAVLEVADGAAETVPVDDPQALAVSIDRVLMDGGRRRNLIEKGLLRAQAFNWDEVADRAWSLYRRLLAV